MANIHLPQISLKNALNATPSGTLLVDASGKPLSSADAPMPDGPQAGLGNRAYSMPIGGGFKYYKLKIPHTDKWAVSWVYKRPIPKGAYAISAEKAFEMMFGTTLAYEGTNKYQWKKVNNNQRGSVIVKGDSQIDPANLPNANSEEFDSTTLKEAERHNL